MPGTNLTREEAAGRAALLSVESYDIELDLTAGPETFASTCRVRFTCEEAGAQTWIDLIAPSVKRIALNGRELDPAEHYRDSRIHLDGLGEHNDLVVEATCAYTNTGEGLHRFTDPEDGEVYLYSQFAVADARRVFAVFEQPDLKAAFTFTITAPSNWRVISNQPAQVQAGPEASIHRFEATPRISCYLAAVIAGPYQGWSDQLTSADGRTIPLGLYARKSLAKHVDAEELFDVTKRGFAFYEPAFDYPYPYTKYDQIFVPEFNAGAMENVGAVTIVESYVFRGAVSEAMVERRAVTVLHELAHMWFGDLVTMRWWNDLWLNESFAEYASTLCAGAATRWTDAWVTFQAVEKTWAYRQDQLPSTHPIMADIRDLEDVLVNFDGITYAKGASVLRQLVAWVGQDAFLKGVAAYFKAYAWGNATLADWLRELEKASGRNLAAWASEWLTSAGVNTLTAQVTAASTLIVQTAPPEHLRLRSQRIGIAGYQLGDGLARRAWRADIEVAGEVTPYPFAAGEPTPAILLPNAGDLGYAKIRLDSASAANALAHLGEVADPLDRAVLWGWLIDITRDAELPARRFVDVALRWLGAESNSSALKTVLDTLLLALEQYVAPGARAAAQTSAGAQLLELTRAAGAGSDAQYQLLRAFAGAARDPHTLDGAQAIVSGAEALPGRVIDADLRWTLLVPLVRGGRAGEAEIAAQLARDGSAAGQVWAAQLRATLPTREAKDRAWRAATEDLTMTNHIQGATIRGFADVNDRSLIAPYVEPYFEVIERSWATRGVEMASAIVTGLYPLLLAGAPGAKVVERTDGFLDQLGDRTPALRRLVLESRARATRALAAQSADA